MESVETKSVDKKKKEDKKNHSVPFFTLFRYATTYDICLMLCGTLGAVAFGAAMPLLSLLFGELTNAFGQNSSDVNKLADDVTKVEQESAV